MTKSELAKAFEYAKQGRCDNSDLHIFDGFGLASFEKVAVTLEAVASLIMWQAQSLNGTWDLEELSDIEYHGRGKFLIIG